MKILIGGSPCTYWSIAQTKNRETEASGLGWELFRNFLIARDKLKPDYFLYENNKSMSAAIRAQITQEFGFEPVLINSALVSAQNRQRLYWLGKRQPDGTYTRVDVEQPEDRGILLRDILETGAAWREKAYALQSIMPEMKIKHLTENEMDYMVREIRSGVNHFDFGYIQDGTKDKAQCITANIAKGVPYNVLCDPVRVGDMPNAAGEISGSQSKRIYAIDGKAPPLQAGGGGCSDTSSPKTGLYAEPVRIGTIESAVKNPDHDSQQYRVYSPDGKSITLCGQGGGVGAKTGLYAVPTGAAWRGHEKAGNSSSYEIRGDQKANAVIVGHQNRLVIETADGKTYPAYEVKDGFITIKDKQYPIKLKDGCYIIRKLTVTECKRLQTVPDGYEFPVSDSQAYKMLGNGWTVDVIAHLLGHIPGIDAEPVEVLSMYDGMSCGHLALDKLGATIEGYYATEIDKYAIKTTVHNFPDVVQLGDAFQVREDGWNIG